MLQGSIEYHSNLAWATGVFCLVRVTAQMHRCMRRKETPPSEIHERRFSWLVLGGCDLAIGNCQKLNRGANSITRGRVSVANTFRNRS